MEKLNEVCIEARKKTEGYFRKFYRCPHGGLISLEMVSAFVCPNCGSPICSKAELKTLPNKHCGKCGYEITSAKEEAMALVLEEVARALR